MTLVICDIVVLYVELVYFVLCLQNVQLVDDICWAPATELTSPEIRSCTKRTFSSTTTTCINLAYTAPNRVGRVVRTNGKIALHVIKMPCWIRNLVYFSPIAILVFALLFNQRHRVGVANLIAISEHCIRYVGHSHP